MALACRICKVPISAVKGCAVCDPVRSNLVVHGEDEEDRPSLSGVSADIVRVLGRQIRVVDRDLTNNPQSVVAEKRALALGNTCAKVLESARKLQVDGKNAVNSMSFAEQAELFVTWYTALPPAYRNAVRARFEQWELEVSTPVRVPSETPLS